MEKKPDYEHLPGLTNDDLERLGSACELALSSIAIMLSKPKSEARERTLLEMRQGIKIAEEKIKIAQAKRGGLI